MPTPSDLESSIQLALSALNEAARFLSRLTDSDAQKIIFDLADMTREKKDFLIKQNDLDLARMDPENPKYDRLKLTPARLDAIINDLKNVAKLPSPLRRTLEHRELPSGLTISKITVPLGVVGIIYESRPNVTFDVFALNLKAGNATVLKGSREAHYSNMAIKQLIDKVLNQHNYPGICFLAPSEREALLPILKADRYIQVIIPRGSQELINYVRKNSLIPVIETGAGIVHTYFDISADVYKGQRVIENAKARRVSVCNALDTLLIHQDRLAVLPILLKSLGEQHRCTIYADEPAFTTLLDKYPNELLKPAKPEDYGREFLSMQMAVKTVSDLGAALDHIHQYSSRHSEAILAEEESTIQQFITSVDAAVVYANTSTAFTDGAQFGLGAEIGISTQKLHARGPMALEELTSYKWVVRSEGAVRS